jgi:hypothetical protein
MKTLMTLCCILLLAACGTQSVAVRPAAADSRDSISVVIGSESSLAEEIQKMGLQPRDAEVLKVEGKLSAEDFRIIRDLMTNLIAIDLSACSAEAIPDFTFAQKKYLESIILPGDLKVIGERCFYHCQRLSGDITLPASVTTVCDEAFLDCTMLQSVVVTSSNLTAIGNNVFGDNDKFIYKANEEIQ